MFDIDPDRAGTNIIDSLTDKSGLEVDREYCHVRKYKMRLIRLKNRSWKALRRKTRTPCHLVSCLCRKKNTG
jgi:hypothetical protein